VLLVLLIRQGDDAYGGKKRINTGKFLSSLGYGVQTETERWPWNNQFGSLEQILVVEALG
jgi:hypothetical protein